MGLLPICQRKKITTMSIPYATSLLTPAETKDLFAHRERVAKALALNRDGDSISLPMALHPILVSELTMLGYKVEERLGATGCWPPTTSTTVRWRPAPTQPPTIAEPPIPIGCACDGDDDDAGDGDASLAQLWQ